MADMIKFYKGLEASLPAAGANGALYITTDEGAIYLGTGTGMKRLGDFVQVDNVASLPAKAHESCLYYCVAENILAKWNGTEWKQINKQPTAEELKTLLGLGSLAYKSEVAEADLNADLAAKINAASGAQHSHDNKTVLDGITAEKVAAWDSAEADAIAHADGLNTAMNTRVEALEAIDHEHANKALLDTYTQTEVDLADAVAKKHAHTFNETELNKIVEGDVAKWNGVAADHLTSEDKTALENSIKEAKKAGTDANTALETYKVSNDARVKAVEDDIAEITATEGGILAQAKSYSDGKLATARTEISAEIDADVKVVNDAFEAYKTSNDSALAGVKATADAAAVKTEVEAELAKKVEKVDGKDLIATSEITRLSGMSDGANKVEASTTNGSIKIDGVETVVYTHPEKHAIADVDGLQDALDAKVAQSAYDADKATFATKTELGNVDAKFANYKTAEAQKAIDDEQDRRLGVIEGDYIKAADIADFETKENVKKVSDDLAAEVKARGEADTALEERIAALEDNFGDGEGTVEAQIAAAVAAEKQRAEGIEGGLRTDVDAIKGDYLKASDKTELEGKITAEETRAKGVEESLQTQINTIMNNPDAEGAINSINEFTKYVEDHGTIAEGFRTDIDKNKEDIAANAKAISDHEALAAETYATKQEVEYTKADLLGVEKDTVDGPYYEETDCFPEDPTLWGLKRYAVNTFATPSLVGELAHATGERVLADAKEYTDGQVDALANGAVADNTAAIATKANAADVYTKEEVESAIAAAVEAAHTWGEF